MERIKQALEKARQERQIREGSSPAPVPTPASGTRPDSRGTVSYTHLRAHET